MEIKDLLGKISTPADVAAVTLGFAAGFAVDVLLFPAGIPPGTIAGVSAVGALGAKNAVTAGMNEVAKRKESVVQKQLEEEKENTARNNFVKQAEALREILTAHENTRLLDRFEKEYALWSYNIIDDTDFAIVLKDIVNDYRGSLTIAEKS